MATVINYNSLLRAYYFTTMISPLKFMVLSLLGLASASSNIPDNLTGQAITTVWGGFDLTAEAACACKQLLNSYSDKILLPISANYTAQTKLFWDVRSDLSPACIFQPDNAEEVADGIKILSGCDAQFAVRGGGHMNVCARV